MLKNSEIMGTEEIGLVTPPLVSAKPLSEPMLEYCKLDL